MSNDLVVLEGITKRFGGVTALDGISFRIAAGEVHAVVGGNGGGKSTLMGILAGVLRPDVGRMLLHGRPLELRGPRDARQLGISIVFQELQLFPHRSVMENIFVSRELCGAGGTLGLAAMSKATREAVGRVGLSVAPETRVGTLSMGERQRVEIARALQGRSELVIFDEPNSALTDGESAQLFEVIRSLRREGITCVYVSQRLEDVLDIADRITVLRDGRYVGTFVTSETSLSEIITAMIGRSPHEVFPNRLSPPSDAPAVLRVEGLASRARDLGPVDLQVRAGEIVGLAGIDGSGVRSLFHLLFGLEASSAGSIHSCGRALRLREPRDAMSAGIGMVPASRRDEGLMVDWPVRRNVTLLMLDRLRTRFGLIDGDAVDASSREIIRRIAVVASGPDATISQLSGGNQQKVLIGKWLATKPAVLLLDDPTRGVDIGAKREIYRLCAELAEQGVGILFSSSELDEIVGLCDRTLVMSRGRVVQEVSRQEASKAVLLRAMAGAAGDQAGVN